MAKFVDIIIFGATGFTGKYALRDVYKFCRDAGRGLTWGIAGRSQEKLKHLLEETASKIGIESVSEIPIIIADITNEKSIMDMAARAKLILNCCGPYHLYGDIVVKCCIENGTHYVDVSAESLFQESIEAKYHKLAEEKGSYVVSGCGVSSLVGELGLTFLKNNFSGTLNSVEVYMSPNLKSDCGSLFHYATWESVVYSTATLKELLALRRSRHLQPLPKVQPQLWTRMPFREAMPILITNKKILPILLPDTDVMRRSQRYFYETNKERPVQVQFYTLMESGLNILLTIVFGLIVLLLSQFKMGQNLLLKNPHIFTRGYISHVAPTADTLQNFDIDFYFYGEGWNETLADGNLQYKMKPNKSILGRVNVKNPGYGFASVAVTLSALMILTQSSKLPPKGGVYTPAVAFSKTTLIEELQKNGTSMEILYNKDL